MKKLQYLFYGAMATILMAADCSNKDSEFYNDVYINAPELVDVEQQGTFNTGDIIWVNTNNFSRFLNEQGQSTPVDVYKTSGGAVTFTFSYLLEKENTSGAWDLIPVDNLVQSDLGNTFGGDFVLAQAIYDAASQQYEYRGGIRLQTAGRYRLSFGYNNGVTSNVVLTSDSINNNLFVNISSYCSDVASGYYYFTVN